MAPISLAILNPIAFILMEYGKQQETKDIACSDITETTLTRNESTSDINSRQEVNERLKSRLAAHESPLTNESPIETGFCCPQRAKAQLKVLVLVTKSIVSNPIVFMTVLGIIGNMFFRYLRFVAGILQVCTYN